MRFIGYYALHSFLNTIKKLFKSWFIIFMVACMVMGGLIGFLVATLVPDDDEILPDDGTVIEEFQGIENPVEELGDNLSHEDVARLLTTIGFLAVAVLIGLMTANSGESGGKIFQPADVVLLFSSPVKPQLVLLFRTVSKLFTSVFIGIYMFYEMPLLLDNGFPGTSVVGLIFTFVLTLCYAQLFMILFYVLASRAPGFKSVIPYLAFVPLVLMLLSYGAKYLNGGAGYIETALGLFDMKWTEFIPVFGTVPAIWKESLYGNTGSMLLFIGLSLIGLVLLAVIIWNLKCDFYEDAMTKSEEVANMMAQANEGGVIARKKERSEKILRNGFNRGWGANTFFFKDMYNRYRFAKLHYFTKTCITYTVVSILICTAVIKLASSDAPGFLIVALVIGGMAFFRSLGNSLSEDAGKSFFILIPESTLKKLFYSLISGTANTLLDMIPAMVIAGIVFRENILIVLFSIIFIVSIDYYSTTVSSFLDVAVNVPSAKMVKTVIQIFFIYFGLLPDIAAIAICAVMLDSAFAMVIGMAIATGINVPLGTAFLLLIPFFLAPKGGKKTGKNMVYSYGEN
ncbi:MAG: putative ABC exporter domain-containing protein [Clostridia bacterium]|nr:putative ABC exporter domain-containing protein [Clostridia bacterium]